MRLPLISLLALTLLAGCGSGSEESSSSVDRAPKPQKGANGAPSPGPAQDDGPETVEPSHCPAGHPACRTAEGRIVFVERVDPDGDGDAHFVIDDPQSITLPGFTAIDVRKGLRPHPLPGFGDLISAAGPVQTGSYGQDQIHALELHVAR